MCKFFFIGNLSDGSHCFYHYALRYQCHSCVEQSIITVQGLCLKIAKLTVSEQLCYTPHTCSLRTNSSWREYDCVNSEDMTGLIGWYTYENTPCPRMLCVGLSYLRQSSILNLLVKCPARQPLDHHVWHLGNVYNSCILQNCCSRGRKFVKCRWV